MLYDHDLTGGRSLPLKKYGLRIHSSGSVQQLVGIMVRHVVVEFREIDSLGLHYLVGRYMVVSMERIDTDLFTLLTITQG